LSRTYIIMVTIHHHHDLYCPPPDQGGADARPPANIPTHALCCTALTPITTYWGKYRGEWEDRKVIRVDFGKPDLFYFHFINNFSTQTQTQTQTTQTFFQISLVEVNQANISLVY
jgi:hypothetical protein